MGSARAYRTAGQYSQDRFDKFNLQQAIDQASQNLGEAAFQAALLEGEQLSIEQAIQRVFSSGL